VRLVDFPSHHVQHLLDGGDKVIVLLPVGSVEPHGPHLPLDTDTRISEAVAERAASRLNERRGSVCLVGPSVGYGITDFASGFAGALSIPGSHFTAFLRSVVESYVFTGFDFVCVINNHLEPAHDEAVRGAVWGLKGRATSACPLIRRWARTLSDEFKSGACHAGRYETSLMLAIDPERVDAERAAELPAVDISLSEGIQDGLTSFADMGIDEAYTGAPAEASAEEGEELLGLLTEMVVTEVTEGMAHTLEIVDDEEDAL
jgi:creatinine amidohydrolase